MTKHLIFVAILWTSCNGFPGSEATPLLILNSKHVGTPLISGQSSNMTTSNSLSRGLGFGLALPSLSMSMIGYFPLPSEELEVFFLTSVNLSPIDSYDNYYNKSETYAGQTLGDNRQQVKNESTLIGGGVGFGATPSVKLFVGGGFRFEDEYAEYYDPFEILSSDGHYWVNGDAGRSTSFNGIGGCVISIGNPMYEVYAFATLPNFDAHLGLSFVF